MLNKIQRVSSFFKKRGFHQGIAEILVRYSGASVQRSPDWFQDLDFLTFPNSVQTLGSERDGPITINWLIPDFGRASGGHINIFRFILLFEKFGIDQCVYVIGSGADDPEPIRELARRTYFPINAQFKILNAPSEVRDADLVIATSWATAYWARSISNVRRKYYMVQDREDMFFAAGALSEFACATYRFGFTGLTAGKWLSDCLGGFGMQSYPFGFSYDRNLYSAQIETKPKTSDARVFLYARPGTERRGLELGILALSLVAAALPTTRFVFAGVTKQNWNLPFEPEYAGVLNLDQLSELYQSCDVALVLSHTNLSLLPLELMASGCPVVSNRGPNVEWMLNETNSILCDPEPRSLANGVLELLTNQERRLQLRKAGLEFVQSTSWELEAERLMQFIQTDLGIRNA
jgi:O-antigen biosynthesis protein